MPNSNQSTYDGLTAEQKSAVQNYALYLLSSENTPASDIAIEKRARKVAENSTALAHALDQCTPSPETGQMKLNPVEHGRQSFMMSGL